MASAKRQSKGDDNSNQKRQKNDPKEQMNINDVIDDCLVMIFSHLDFKSMVDVGISSETLRNAAKIAILRKYGGINKKLVLMYPSYSDSYYGDTIQIGGLKNCLQFLRCFGVEIFKLMFDYSSLNKPWCELTDFYIGNYCDKFKLTNLRVIGSSNVLAGIKKPFKNLHNLCIRQSDLGQQFLRFSTLFPALRHLKIDESNGFRHIGAFNANFPQLEHLYIGFDNQNRFNGFSQKNLTMILHSNPQLSSLKILMPTKQGISFEKFLNMICGSVSLTKLVITTGIKSHKVNETEVNRFADVLPALIEIDIRRFRFTSENALFLMSRLNSLRRFFLHFTMNLLIVLSLVD